MKYFDSYSEEKNYFEEQATEDEFSNWYHKQDNERYDKPSVTVDLIGLRENNGKLQLLLVQRKHHPFKGMWALPGGFIEKEESINHAVIREVKEETNVDIQDNKIIRMPAVSAPGRDPRMWVITNPNIVLFKPKDQEKTKTKAGDDAKNLEWVDVELDKNNKLVISEKLAFDHFDIVERALNYLRKDFDHRRLPLIVTLLGEEITTLQMLDLFSKVNKSFVGMQPNNLKLMYNSSLIPTEKTIKPGKESGGGRPKRVYRYLLAE